MKIVLAEASVGHFKTDLRGGLIQPDDEGYDEARKVYNAMIDRRPRMLARCADVADVMTSVDFARDNDMLLAVRGGHNYLTRKYGLTIDNLIEADVVLADGRFVTASEGENADLFWAIRGGGGNPVSTVYAGPMLWDLDRAEEVMRWYREFSPQAPDDMYGFFAFLIVPPAPPFPEHLHLKKMCAVVWCYSGPMEGVEEAFRPVRQQVGPAAFEFLGPMPLPMLNGPFDELYPPGLQWYWRCDFVTELTDEAIAVHLRHGSEVPAMHSSMHLYPIDGAAHRVGRHETASATATPSGPRSSWAWTRTRQTTSGSSPGQRSTGTRCTRTRAAGRT